jgi:hypothetical protein
LEKPKPKPESEEALLKEGIMQMASAPDPMAELYNIFLDLKTKRSNT